MLSTMATQGRWQLVLFGAIREGIPKEALFRLGLR